MRVVGINVYPVKSTRGLALSRATIERCGLTGDRRWGVVEEDGEPLTARECDTLLTIEATPAHGGGVTLNAPDMPALAVPVPDPEAPQVPVRYISLDRAIAVGGPADAWLTKVLQHPVRLVWLGDTAARQIDEIFGGRPGDVMHLGDTAAVHLTSAASLDQLNSWIAEAARERGEPAEPPLAMARFRPNIVIEGSPAFAEDGWTGVRIGALDFHVAGGCGRCVMTTIDPQTLVHGKEPIRTMSRHRKWDGQVWFGVQLALDTGRQRSPAGVVGHVPPGPDVLGEIRLGNPVLAY